VTPALSLVAHVCNVKKNSRDTGRYCYFSRKLESFDPAEQRSQGAEHP